MQVEASSSEFSGVPARAAQRGVVAFRLRLSLAIEAQTKVLTLNCMSAP